MMYLSTLLIDTGTDPDRPRPGRLWLRNHYRVHQRLCMAFPSARRRLMDGDFLQPYQPGDFPEDRLIADQKKTVVGEAELRHVHAPRTDKAGFLFRVDPLPGGGAAIVVLSAARPDWDYAFGLKDARDDRGRPIGNAGHLLAAPPMAPRPMRIDADNGRQFRFRLQANPTKRSPSTKDQWHARRTGGEQPKRPRLQLTWGSGDDPAAVFTAWLTRKATGAGFRLLDVQIPSIGYVFINRGKDGDTRQRLRSVRYEGTLEVTDASAFRSALAAGIGPGKAFGFGLLSIAPAG